MTGDDRALQKFRRYLQIRSDHPEPDYEACVEFLTEYAQELGLAVAVFEAVAGNPIVVMTWAGLEPELPAVLLNSHMDVVPADPATWTHHPFEAFKDEFGNIFGRGAQDMKSVAVQHLEAVYRLKVVQQRRLRRTVHLR